MAKKRKTELDIETGAIPAPPPPEPAPSSVSLEQEMAQDSAPPRTPGGPMNKKIIITAGVIAAVVLAIIIAVTIVEKKKPPAAKKNGKETHGEKAKGAEKKKAEEVKFEKLNNLVLDPFVIPYKNKGQDGFIQVVFALQVNDPEVIDEITNNLPLIRNSILFAISTHPQTDLIDTAKREALMKDIRYNVDRSLQTGRVDAILLNGINVY